MRKSSIFLATSVFLLAGCSHQPTAYVDLDSILKNSSAGIKTKSESVAVKTGDPASFHLKSTLPSLPAASVNGPKTNAYEQAESVVLKNREKALRELQRHLEKLYIDDIRRKEEESISSLAPAEKEREAKFLDEYQAAFSTYAGNRAPLVVKLALLAGWPDRGPTDPGSGQDAAARKINEANAVRTKIAILDKRFERSSAQLAARYSSEADKALTEIRAKTEIAKSEALERARDEALGQIRAAEGTSEASISESQTLSLPAVPEKSIALVMSANKISLPDIDSGASKTASQAKQDSIIEELKIWLAINGYRRAKSPEEGPDRTAEFLLWRNTHHHGL